MRIRELETGTDHERVVECQEPESAYHAIIAVHSTVLGPAVGGTRLWSYDTVDAALADALRLSQAMTLKCAAAGIDLGGGKSVILAPTGAFDRRTLFRAHGRAIESLGGRYIAGEDVGTSPRDMEYALEETRYVAGLPGRSGDPSPKTARGVLRAIQAAVHHRTTSDSLAERVVAIQGCGNVGHHLARELAAVGATLIVTDVDPQRAARTAAETGARAVETDAIYDVQADIFAPCALGGAINDGTIPRFRATIIAGAANNQLANPQAIEKLGARGILYVPDFIANAGGVINGARELTAWDEAEAARRIEGIYDVVRAVLERAEHERITTAEAAVRLAQARLDEHRATASS
jgi:leucine dehydrogenase